MVIHLLENASLDGICYTSSTGLQQKLVLTNMLDMTTDGAVHLTTLLVNKLLCR